MCAIAGAFGGNDQSAGRTVADMLKLVTHRGPDGHGVVHFRQDQLEFDQSSSTEWGALGHNRLSIIDLSDHASQPMTSSCGKYCLVFNGEIYNYLELRKDLEEEGCLFRTESDSEVLLQGLILWGKSYLNRLRGMFAFAFTDIPNRRTLLARDHLGIKPLYLLHHRGILYFSSEIKQFSVVDNFRFLPNYEIISQFLIWGISDNSNETFFSNVEVLPAGHMATIDVRSSVKLNIEKWWQPEALTYRGTFEDAVDDFRTLFRESLSLHMRADVGLGACLSGGLDSSAIVSGLSGFFGSDIERIKTFTASSENHNLDEKAYALAVARHANADPFVVTPNSRELWDVLPRITWHQDEPIGSTSIFAQWKVFELASQNGVKVVLDGQGADELLAGYDSFINSFLYEQVRNLNFQKALQNYKIFEQSKRTSLSQFASASMSHVLPSALMSMVGRVLRSDSYKSHGWLGAGVYEHLDNANPFHQGHVGQSVSTLTDDMLFRSSLPKLLRYEDRNSMAHSIESRVPFCDPKLVMFLKSLPSEYLIRDGNTKAVMRNAMKDFIPSSVMNRKDKIGFEMSQKEWMSSSTVNIHEILKLGHARLPKIFADVCEEKIHSVNKSGSPMNWRTVSTAMWATTFEIEE
jgi:asparagine synthase (glutamine-hydrolysing)